MTAHKGTFLSCREGTDTAQMQTENRIVRVQELQRAFKAQPRQVCSAKARALVGKAWDLKMWDRAISMDSPEEEDSTVPFGPSGPKRRPSLP